MRMPGWIAVWLGVAALGVGCNDTTTESNKLTGDLAFPVGGAASGSPVMVSGGGGGGEPDRSEVKVALAANDFTGTCSSSSGVTFQGKVLTLDIHAGSGSTVVPGTSYSILETATSFTAYATLSLTDVGSAGPAHATEGTVSLSALDGTHAVGQFQATMQDENGVSSALSGAFDAADCLGLFPGNIIILDAGSDGGNGPTDAGLDAGPDAGADAGPDLDGGPDAGVDAGADAGGDAGGSTACVEILPSIFPTLGRKQFSSYGVIPIAVDATGSVYLGWSELGSLNPDGGKNGDTVRVYRLAGSAWAEVGTGVDQGYTSEGVGFSSGTPMGMVLDDQGNPVVAYFTRTMSGGPLEVGVSQWDGAAWVLVGPTLVSPITHFIEGFGIALVWDPAQLAPIVALSQEPHDIAHHPTADVYRWSGSSWTMIGSEYHPFPGSSIDQVQNPSLAISSTGLPAVAWDQREGPPGDVEQYFPFSSELPGGPLEPALTTLTSSYQTNPSIAYDSSDAPVVAWEVFDHITTLGLAIHRWNGSSWQQLLDVGDGGFLPGTFPGAWAGHQLIANPNGRLAAVTQYGSQTSLNVVSVWEQGVDAGWSEICSPLIDSDGGPLVSQYKGVGVAVDNAGRYIVAGDRGDAVIEVQRMTPP